MNPTLLAVRLGLARAWIEFKHSLTNRGDLTWIVTINTIFVVVMICQRARTSAARACPWRWRCCPA
jgi:hypothetical protein